MCIFFFWFGKIEKIEISRNPRPFQWKEQLLTFYPIYLICLQCSVSHASMHTEPWYNKWGPHSTAWLVTCLSHVSKDRSDFERCSRGGSGGRNCVRKDPGAQGTTRLVHLAVARKFLARIPSASPARVIPVSSMSDCFSQLNFVTAHFWYQWTERERAVRGGRPGFESQLCA